MPRTRLKSTDSSTSDNSTSTFSSSDNSNTIISASEVGNVAVSLPGLADFSIDRADQFVPSTNREANQITDLLRPQITDKLTTSAKDQALNEYELGINAEKVKQKGFDYIGEQFKTEINRNKTIGEFVKVGTSIENVKGAVIDYFTTVEQNREKGAKYVTAQATSHTAIAIIPETLATLDEKLRAAQIKREQSIVDSQSALKKLENARFQLGEVSTLEPMNRNR